MKNLIIVVMFLAMCVGHSQAATVDAAASRTSGLAPLAVIFHADLWASSPTEKRFHEYHYAWDFGDTGSGNWATGHSKNTDTGPVAAHVFESAGTYTVTLVVRDSSTGEVVSGFAESFEITVTDFAGAVTTCINPIGDADFTGCPSGATQVNENASTNWGGYAQAGERVLFKRGGTWTLSSRPAWGYNHGPVMIGAYGTCTGATALGTCSNDPQFTMSNGNEFLWMENTWDWRVANLHIIDGTTPGEFEVPAIGSSVDHKNILLMRNTIAGFGSSVSFSNWDDVASNLVEKLFAVENDISLAYDDCLYIGAEYLAVLGNKLYDTYDSHVLRVWQSYIGVVAHNDVSGASYGSVEGSRAALKFHGPSEAQLISNSTNEVDHRSAFSVVSGNIFGNSGNWPVNIDPQNAQEDERISDIIYERNKMLSDYGTDSNTLVRDALHVSGSYFTIRNNIFDGTGADTSYFYGVRVEHRLDPVLFPDGPYPNNMWIYNNTTYSQTAHTSEAYGVWVDDVATGITVRNNYSSFPNATGSKGALIDNSSAATASNNVDTDTPLFDDPTNANPLLRDFSLTGATSAGYIVPVYDDFTGTVRSGTFDIGAFEYVSPGPFHGLKSTSGQSWR